VNDDNGEVYVVVSLLRFNLKRSWHVIGSVDH
jgi:hypothetical protein